MRPDLEARINFLLLMITGSCIQSGFNLTVYDGGIGFVDQEAKKIVFVWRPEYTANDINEVKDIDETADS